MAPSAKFYALNICVLLQEVLILLQGKTLWTPLGRLGFWWRGGGAFVFLKKLLGEFGILCIQVYDLLLKIFLFSYLRGAFGKFLTWYHNSTMR